jgi:hypothetical protein
MTMKRGEPQLDRRRALVVLGGLCVGGVFALAGCGGGSDNKSGAGSAAPAGGTGCDAPITADSKTLRRNLQYKEKASDPAKKCVDCAQYEAGKFGDCGGCKLFPGPVRPEGGCASFAPKNGAAPASAAPAGSG